MFQPLNAKVEAPNYHFDLNVLNDFMPGKNARELDKKYGKAEVMEEVRTTQTLKYYITHPRYRFPVLVQAQEGVIQDFHARLPSYFLHDTFFQSLVNRLGKQDGHKKTLEEAYYTWSKEPLKHIYSAACTITCFPIFYAVQKNAPETPPLLEKMKRANSGN